VSGLLPINVTWWLLDAAYLTVGWTIGLSYTREILLFVARVLPTLLLSTFVLLGMCALAGVLLVVLIHVDPLTAYLATTRAAWTPSRSSRSAAAATSRSCWRFRCCAYLQS